MSISFTDSPKPLISVILLCYNNSSYIFTALDSVFMQDYENIELIVSDDSSKFFDRESIKKYVDEKKSQNISSVLINVNPKNLGTVEHIEMIRSKSHGEYELVFAVDDALDNETVLSSFVTEFERLGQDAMIITSQIGMYDEYLEQKIENFISEEDKRLLLTGTPEQIFEEISYRCFIPAPGTCYRRSFFDNIGSLSELYSIVEDWPTYVRAARQHIKIYYIDQISARHRSGGISHGNSLQAQSVYLRYLQDMARVYEIEIKPYENRLSEITQEKCEQHYKALNKMIRQWTIMVRLNRIAPGLYLFYKCLYKFFYKLKSLINNTIKVF